ncbi:serine/threonine-protein kinase MHK [Andrographis paniculata]|uniref:serine/threonine-protein kinase MHK n=1 Tax=Andrographis paniculata TaxID=175694 RepID=UPI0021E84462|nr:serine/threonine-protein kinase MHK [Andrographis paniculata]XP_051152977.1 serine/threonine-protein kinase MHK [Andrographis paniculata]
MEKYKFFGEIGDGSCGHVYKAINIETSEIVAVKKMKRKYYYWEECVNLREVKSLRRLNHPNVIKLLEIVRQNNELFFIFEYMEHNLYQIMKDRQTSFSEEEIRAFMSQVLQGLAHVHQHGYFHRDLKPENLLVTNNMLKIADFGLARELSSSPPFTDYVSTRWYRAPEVLLHSSSYTPAIDMWAVGAILAELFTLNPLFPGESEIDQLYKIFWVLGAPELNSFPHARNIIQLTDISYSYIKPASLSDIIPNASLEAIDLIKQLCSWDPLKRPTAEQCLHHPFFHVASPFPRPLGDGLKLSLGAEPNLELNLWDFGASKDDCFLGLTLAVNPSVPNLGREMICRDQGAKDDVMIHPSYIDHSQQSVFWSMFPANHHVLTTSVEPSLSLAFSSGSNPSANMIPESAAAGFTVAPFQANGGLDRPVLASSAPFPQHHRYL